MTDKRGRPQNMEVWAKLKFRKHRYGNGKDGAQCLLCEEIIKNSGLNRLQRHRNNCLIIEEDSDDTIMDICENAVFSPPNPEIQQQDSILSIDTVDDFILGVSLEEQSEREAQSTCAIRSSTPRSASTSLSRLGTSLSTNSFSSGMFTERSLKEGSSQDCNVATKKKNKSPKKTKRTKPSFSASRFMDTMSQKDQHDLTIELGKFFFGCNIPFSVVESTPFINFLKKLRPAYHPPSRKTLSTTILDTVYKSLRDEKILSGECVLLIDGWKNTANNTKNVVSMIQSIEKKQNIFLKSWDFTGQSETADSLKTVVNESIDLSLEQYSINIYAVISDNAKPMVKMGKEVNIWHTTCSSHTGNLFAKDIVPVELANNVNTIIKEFRHPDLTKKLIEKQGKRVITAADTRWCSYRDSFQNLLDNLQTMKVIAAEEGVKLKMTVVHLLYNEQFIQEVKDSVGMFDPICQLINKCQHSDTSIGDAVEYWKDPNFVSQYENTTYFQKFIERQQTACSIYAMAANYLHPIYRGKRLSTLEIESVYKFLIEELSPDGINQLSEFVENTGFFQTLLCKPGINPQSFWVICKNKYKELAELALKLIRIPAATAAIERLFSEWSYVHSMTRNRLTQERSQKLLYVYHTMKSVDKNQSPEY